jgi:hypothetical protein
VFINPSPFKHPEKSMILGDPPPLSPSLDKGGGISYVRGASPLLTKSSPFPSGEGGQGDGVNAAEKRNMIICVTNISKLAQALFVFAFTAGYNWKTPVSFVELESCLGFTM